MAGADASDEDHNEAAQQERERICEENRQIHKGFIAQELEKVFPEWVSEDEHGYKSIDLSEMFPVLVEAIKDQNAMIRGPRFYPSNELHHRMYPRNPMVFQNIFEAAALGEHDGKTTYIKKLGNSLYDAQYVEEKWGGRRMILYGKNEQQDGNGAEITVPEGYDTLWLRCPNDRWNNFKVDFLDGDREPIGQWNGGKRHSNPYCPDGSLADSTHNKHL